MTGSTMHKRWLIERLRREEPDLSEPLLQTQVDELERLAGPLLTDEEFEGAAEEEKAQLLL